jgi:hypothetical protein
MLVPDEQPGGDRAGDDPARHAEPGEAGERVGAVRLDRDREDRRDRVVRVEVPLVDQVVDAAADQRRDRDDDHPRPDDVLVEAAEPRLPDDDPVDGGEAHCVRDPVPVDREAEDPDEDRVGEDVDHGWGVYGLVA